MGHAKLLAIATGQRLTRRTRRAASTARPGRRALEYAGPAAHADRGAAFDNHEGFVAAVV